MAYQTACPDGGEARPTRHSSRPSRSPSVLRSRAAYTMSRRLRGRPPQTIHEFKRVMAAHVQKQQRQEQSEEADDDDDVMEEVCAAARCL